MKRYLILSAALIFTLTACQESPESDIIEQKQPVNAANTVAASDGTNGIANYDAPEHWQESVSFDNSEVKIEIDAEVEVPQNDTLSTYKINEAAGISQERVDILVDEIFGDTTIYDANKELTRSEIEDMILRLKQQQAEAAAEPDDGNNRRGEIAVFRSGGEGGDAPVVINDRGGMFDRMIETYEEMLTTAPETVEDVPLVPSVDETDADFVSFSGTGEVEGKGSYSISYMASERNNLAPTLNIANTEYMLLETDDSEEQNAENAPSKEEAVQAAEALVEKLGLTGMKISETTFAKQNVSGDMFSGFSENEGTGKYGYIVKFSREVDNIPCISGNNFGGLNISAGRGGGGNGGNGGNGGGAAGITTSVIATGAARMTGGSVRRMMGNDELTIGVTQNGVEEISWSGYFEVGDVITEDTSLLSFDEVREIFKKNMELTYTVRDPDEQGNGNFRNFFSIANISDTYNIYKASLCYTKSVIANDSDNSMLTPVWAFYSYQVDDNGNSIYTPTPVLIINAIDGSVI